VLLSGKDKAGEFYRDSFYGLFQYVSNRIPEISDELYKIDDAVCAGFGWEVGPFATWDAVGVAETVKQMEEAGYKPNQWVYDIIGNQAAQFSVGANLGIVFMYAIEQEYDEINFMVKHFQDTMMRVRYSSVPVVVAPHGMTLGGGCEMTLHADHVQAAAETYIGLVEVGVGLIPAGGGTKEMTKRISDAYPTSPET